MLRGGGIVKVLRVNTQIRVPEVMLIGHDGAQIGVVPIGEALEHATDAELDLVEVAPNARPPVCKIMDYGKFKYRQSKKAHDAKKKQKHIKVKEVKITPTTEEHDYRFKLNHAKRFIEHGDKVKITVFFRGRQITHTELGFKVLQRFAADLDDVAVLESEAKQEGRNLTMVFGPKPDSAAMKARAAAGDEGEEETENLEQEGH